ncbi:MAG: OsmC family protein [Gammaproteobacteria bacterium]|nr:OsmC family protein [Gammaproteobacteria bacterium]MDH3372464.1 OsmC family protein [Gammaproteobacteria bacterium]MDH3407900.1 OsmC family protein [Gammaproteobacteria bacterium]MDH3551850.1 OsmC family protein [Gammaproteobacteria bacterium]
MQDFPHHYVVVAAAQSDSNVQLASPGLDNIESAGPAEFGGPGDLWSPETLLVASVADCFILSFKAIARASKLEWKALSCDVVGELNSVARVTRFTRFNIRAVLEVPVDTNADKARRVLDKAEQSCLITNSMIAASRLEAEVRVTEAAA